MTERGRLLNRVAPVHLTARINPCPSLKPHCGRFPVHFVRTPFLSRVLQYETHRRLIEMRRSLSILVLVVVLAFSVAAVAQGQDSSQSKAAGTASSADGVKYFPKDDVMASFAKGGTLVTESNYKVMTAHRTPATEPKVEVHRSYTDVFYIVQGNTTII